MAEYIDREAAVKAANEWVGEACMAPVMRVSRLFDKLQKVPAADVAPVVHGRWDGNDCTVCKLPWNYNMVQDADDWGYFDPMPDYCPNCGAKMDGGDGDATLQ